MSARSLRATGAAALALAALTGVFAFLFLRAQAGTPGLSGEWNLQLEGDAIAACELQIEQNGTELSGTWSCAIFGDGSYTGVVVEELGQTAFTLEGELQGVAFEAEGTVDPDGNGANGTWLSAELDLDGFFFATRKVPLSTPTQPSGPTSTPAPPTATSPVPPGVIGDANCNNNADAIDASLILQLSAALLDELACEGNADVNGDGRVDAIDATLVLQFVAGLLDSLPPAGSPPITFY
jgi:hypothetical protein